MKKTITALFLSLFASAAFAQAVSASAVANDVSSPYINSEEVSAPSVDGSEVSAPYVAAMGCCAVSVSANALAGRVSIPQKEDDSDSMKMAGLGFGLLSLVGVSKLARRKKQK